MKKIWSDTTVRSCVIASLLCKFGITVIAALYVLFLRHEGLNVEEVNQVNAVFFITLLIFEIPTGALADVIGRRNAVVIACGIEALGLFIYAGTHTFIGFAVAEVLCAFGGTLYSGAFYAWLHDQLEKEGRAHEQQRIMAMTNMCEQVTWVIAAAIGTFVAQWGYSYAFILGGIAMLCCGVYSARVLHDGAYEKRSFSKILPMLWEGVDYARKHRAIRTLFTIDLIQWASLMAINMQWPFRFEPFLPNDTWLSGINALMAVGMFVGAEVARRMYITRYGRTMAATELLIAAGILVAALSHNFPIILLAFVIHEAGRGFFIPVRQSFLNKCITSSHKRATVISCQALSRDAGGIIGLKLSGFIALHYSIPTAWVISGLALVTTIFFIPGRLRC